MTLNGAIMQLVEMRENSMMPEVFKPYFDKVIETISECEEPSAQPERKRMSNKEWVDFLSEQFTVSRTSAREMLHGLMKWKAEDNFKKQFSGRK